jgi:hypothetical protein
MAREVTAIYRLNRGIVDRRALSHAESPRLAMSAQTQVNWLSHVIGHMTLRPGLGMVGEIAGNPTLPTPAPTPPPAVDDTLYRVPYAQFAPVAGTIDFEDKSDGASNPVYAPADYGASAPSPTVRFGGLLPGQTATTLFDTDGQGFLTGTVTSPIATVGGTAEVWTDGGRGVGEQKALTGNSSFAGPFVMVLDDDVVGAGFSLGGLNTAASCRVRVYDRTANLLGTWTSTSTDLPTFEDFYFRRGSDTPIIAAITVEVGGGGLGDQVIEAQGAAIDNIEFTHTGIPGGPI